MSELEASAPPARGSFRRCPAQRDTGWHITDTAAVAWTADVSEEAWVRSLSWQEARAATADAVTTERRRAILRQMEAGEGRQIAGRLDLSERAISKELLSPRSVLGLATGHQLMVRWARAAERRIP
ncbi:hypothetical protein [Streptomyces clavuligerus]|uniref:Uncharacterized protein n=1 Tax=Streptomyces clavuligerus TaxID=1901 RepID=B5GW28_STRCL|nr:hypothetical protein [Streptomyces clavuligerus]EDY50524.1 hypothetical protein SSCG_03671 [Streptomyces clavuligerus]EFG03573.1 Hypothetical protein SCLAV_p0082 [Streptomyces clavuligerus]MBY6307847.1 hypothetical protein [Streptomyces clavuligerus]QCS09600.1 hypothetical protein CRV15_28540 [Streptomyces clavuligerus]QPJ98351.1 hypothetical protein GE265_35785 [Streptomyces clavuligerus]